MKFYYKPAFLKAFDKLDRPLQELALKTDNLIKEYVRSGKASFGLRIKNLHQGIYEGRLNDRLRVVWVKEEGAVTFALLGNHEEVRRFIKRC